MFIKNIFLNTEKSSSFNLERKKSTMQLIMNRCFGRPALSLVSIFAVLSLLIGQSHGYDDDEMEPMPVLYNSWMAGSNNCTCVRELTAIRKELQEEITLRRELKGALETYVSELYELRAVVRALRNNSKSGTPEPEKYSKLSFYSNHFDTRNNKFISIFSFAFKFSPPSIIPQETSR